MAENENKQENVVVEDFNQYHPAYPYLQES